MEIKSIYYVVIILWWVTCSGRILATDESFGYPSQCAESLEKSYEKLDKSIGISTYRLLNAYPPKNDEGPSVTHVIPRLKSSFRRLNVSPACFEEDLVKSTGLYSSGKMVNVSNDDVIPVRVFKYKEFYLLIFLYPGYVERDDTGDELAAGMAVYKKGSGSLLEVIEGIASWANNEGTIVLRESCLRSEVISTSVRYFYPDKYGEGGRVIGYEPVFDVSKITRNIMSEEVSSSGGYECLDSSYIKLERLQ